MALVGVLSLTLAAAPLPAMAEEGGSASDENATQTVTVYHFEMVYYDDPTFEDWGVPELTGLRLIGTSTVEGLKPGDVVRAWDQVGTSALLNRRAGAAPQCHYPRRHSWRNRPWGGRYCRG